MTPPQKPTYRLGFTPAAERLNGRLAMLGFVTAVVIELVSGEGVLQFLGIL
ncbi:chlorophyll a/b-binding protein [Almyronema epifaneia]|uniref:Chlorophyll a/b-binding protein n=1 Tax=Almyronema epifaneia S1 TaxID=2991925 RepID=A0ABW6IIE9_9CYAN